MRSPFLAFSCLFVFVLTSRNVDPNDPNYAKKRALPFAQKMNINQVGSDHHTLYNVYDLEAAFGLAPGSTRQDTVDLNLEREWFRAASTAFASLCSGLVYLVVDPDELPALLSSDSETF